MVESYKVGILDCFIKGVVKATFWKDDKGVFLLSITLYSAFNTFQTWCLFLARFCSWQQCNATHARREKKVRLQTGTKVPNREMSPKETCWYCESLRSVI